MASSARAALNRWLDSRQAQRVLRWVQIAFAVAGAFAVVGIIDDSHPLGLPDWFWSAAWGYTAAVVIVSGGVAALACTGFFGWACVMYWRGMRDITQPLEGAQDGRDPYAALAREFDEDRLSTHEGMVAYCARVFFIEHPFLSEAAVIQEVDSCVHGGENTIAEKMADGVSTHDVIAIELISGVIFEKLLSGSCHIYRGCLSGVGEDMLRCFVSAQKELHRVGRASFDDAADAVEFLKRRVREIG